jgi:hypothetical protein
MKKIRLISSVGAKTKKISIERMLNLENLIAVDLACIPPTPPSLALD